jgi:DNA-binding response OmpR family regulator
LAERPQVDVAADRDATHLQLGFRGVAAGFQPGVRDFLVRHGGLLRGLTRIDEAKEFQSSVSELRPDYFLLAGADDPRGLLDKVRLALRSPQLAVLVVGGHPIDAESLPAGVSVDVIGDDADATDVALVLRSLMRRTRPQAMVGQTTWHDLGFDEARLTFSVGDRSVALSLEASAVLGLMMDDPDRVWERETLHRLVFGAGSGNDIRAVDMRISRARRLVSAALGCDPVRTVRGVGYALVPRP